MTPLVSIIIPVYNRTDLLDITLESVSKQTMRNYEVIVCDDGSDEDIESVVKKYDKRFRVLKLKHTGLPAIARNAGIISARGQFIAFLDSDDIWLPEKLEKQLLFAKGYPHLGMIATNAYRVAEEKDEAVLYFGEMQTYHGNIITNLLSDNMILCSSVLIKAHLIKKTGLFCEEKAVRAIEDYDLWLRFAMITECGIMSDPLLLYRDNQPDSIRLQQSKAHRAEGHLHILQRLKKFAKKHSIPVPNNIYLKARRNYKKNLAKALSWKNIVQHITVRISIITDSILIKKYN